MSDIEIRQFMCRSDNFGVLVHHGESGVTIAIDAPEEKAIRRELDAAGWSLTHILVTHHHGDHTEAVEPLKAAFGATVYGPAKEVDKIAGIDKPVKGGDAFEVGAIRVEVIDTPGHTAGEISYYLPGAPALFAADALFSLGCGRLFEGDAAMLWESLKRLRALPDETMLYCGHEYTATNAKCAVAIDPGNTALRNRVAEVERLREEGKPTLPVALGTEKLTNPFLRADDPILKGELEMLNADPAEVFAVMRRRRDQY
ncbi:hydroxyacylglutathione hydrolase [Consotaella salsifontis]|uniref:Hydroxyacylglutathione hydrolase n=1 Tax=Consotaella salsifontis TaxID=1365950 RepID=A0A1T4RQY5_9HYPH|nr:hydroxyacylglutathione hydrolase [Consotaella salsifontis]SKA18352.1 hydroxyacylglutathione hydrolase [Consotaella salsifontis]